MTKLNTTLYDAIRGQEEHFEQVVMDGVEKGLKELGARIYDLEWANIEVAAQKAKAA